MNNQYISNILVYLATTAVIAQVVKMHFILSQVFLMVVKSVTDIDASPRFTVQIQENVRLSPSELHTDTPLHISRNHLHNNL